MLNAFNYALDLYHLSNLSCKCNVKQCFCEFAVSGVQSWNVFIKNLNFFLTEERKTWTSWMAWGRVNYQQKKKSELLL